MKCGIWVKYESAKTNDKTGGKARFAVEWFDERNIELPGHGFPADFGEGGYEKCDGDIVATVEAAEEIGYRSGLTRASLEVGYRCEKCGHAHYPQLPNSFNISEWLTATIAGLSETQAKGLMDDYLEKERKHREELEAICAKGSRKKKVTI